jgi:hypothetical protein
MAYQKRHFFLITWFNFFLIFWTLLPQKVHASDAEATLITLPGFSIEAPSSLIRLNSSQTPGRALLILKAKSSRFPNFNVVYSPGNINLKDEGSSALKQRLETSYAEVGILDAKVTSSKMIKLSGKEAFRANLEYLLQNQVVQSSVAIVSDPLEQGVYYLTMLDSKDNSAASAPLYDALLTSFQLTKSAKPSPKDTIDPSGSTRTDWLPGIAFVLIAFGVALLIYRRKRT